MEPKLVGIWVVACTIQGDLIKWGKDRDSIHPYETMKKAVEQANYLCKTKEHKNDAIYLLIIFDNGQMLTIDFEASTFKEGN